MAVGTKLGGVRGAGGEIAMNYGFRIDAVRTQVNGCAGSRAGTRTGAGASTRAG